MAVTGLFHAYLPDAPWRSLLDSFGYSVGFLIVVLGRPQLFTENTLTVILPLLTQSSMRIFPHIARLEQTPNRTRTKEEQAQSHRRLMLPGKRLSR